MISSDEFWEKDAAYLWVLRCISLKNFTGAHVTNCTCNHEITYWYTNVSLPLRAVWESTLGCKCPSFSKLGIPILKELSFRDLRMI